MKSFLPSPDTPRTKTADSTAPAAAPHSRAARRRCGSQRPGEAAAEPQTCSRCSVRLWQRPRELRKQTSHAVAGEYFLQPGWKPDECVSRILVCIQGKGEVGSYEFRAKLTGLGGGSSPGFTSFKNERLPGRAVSIGLS